MLKDKSKVKTEKYLTLKNYIYVNQLVLLDIKSKYPNDIIARHLVEIDEKKRVLLNKVLYISLINKQYIKPVEDCLDVHELYIHLVKNLYLMILIRKDYQTINVVSLDIESIKVLSHATFNFDIKTMINDLMINNSIKIKPLRKYIVTKISVLYEYYFAYKVLINL